MKGVFQRIKYTLVPSDDMGKELLFSIADGAECIVEMKGKHNIKQFRLFWGLCQLVAEADDDTKLNVKKWLCVATGHTDIWFEPNGKMHVDPASISFSELEQNEFNEFFQRALILVADRLGSKPNEIRQRLEEMLAPKAH